MVKPQLGHDQVVLEYRWSLNTGGHKSRFHSTWLRYNLRQYKLIDLDYEIYLYP